MDASATVPRFIPWTVGALRADGFTGFVPFAELPTIGVPTEPGIYMVLRTSLDRPTFRLQSTAGRFKDRDPSAPVEVLESEWVTGAEVVYIGKANWGSKQTGLRRRLSEYRRHGEGKPVGHRGGEWIWQLDDSAEFLVAWKTMQDADVRPTEARLIDEFQAVYGRWPFANRKRERERRQER